MTTYEDRRMLGSTFYGFSNAKQTGKLLHAGWLYKKGGRIPTMKKRWFTLKGDVLYYYSDEKETKLLGFIPLDVSTVHKMPPDPKHAKKFRLEITASGGRQILSHNHSSFSIYSESETLRDNWYAVLHKVIHAPKGGGIFGAYLHEVVENESYMDGGGHVPLIVLKSMQFILKYGKEEPGILQHPAIPYKLQLLEDKFNEGQNPIIPESEDVHTVAGLLKKYFKELPEPIIPPRAYLECLFGIKYYDKHPETGLEELFKIFSKLPYPNFCLLEILSLFCEELLSQEFSIKNHLTFAKSALIFGPTIFGPQSEDEQLLLAYPDVMDKLLMIMIQHKDFFFPTIAQKNLTLLERIELLLQGSSPGEVGILSPIDFRKKKHTLMQNPPIPPRPSEPTVKKRPLSKDDSYKMKKGENPFKRCETEVTRRTARNAGEDGCLFPENQQGYVEFDLFVDSDEIEDSTPTPTATPATGSGAKAEKMQRLPPPPPPKPKKYSFPVASDLEEDTQILPSPINTLSAVRMRANSKSTSDIAQQLEEMERKQEEWKQKWQREHDDKEEVYKRLSSIEKMLEQVTKKITPADLKVQV